MFSSSLPALEGVRVSSNGETNGPVRLSLLVPESELQLVLREDMPEGERIEEGESSSLNLRVRDTLGGMRNSADSATGPGYPYTNVD